jgi:glutamate/tyrosine decarboxylase-like PLP-dependent enzyme
MSSIEDAKQQLAKVVTESEGTASALAQFKDAFDSLTDGVMAAIGNTATGTDADIAKIYEAAKTSIDQTVSTLAQAAQASKDFATRL